MKIRIEKPFYDKAMSPIAFQPGEYLTVADSIAKRLIKTGHATALDKLETR